MYSSPISLPGVDIGDVDEKAHKMSVTIGEYPTPEEITAALLRKLPQARKGLVQGGLDL